MFPRTRAFRENQMFKDMQSTSSINHDPPMPIPLPVEFSPRASGMAKSNTSKWWGFCLWVLDMFTLPFLACAWHIEMLALPHVFGKNVVLCVWWKLCCIDSCYVSAVHVSIVHVYVFPSPNSMAHKHANTTSEMILTKTQRGTTMASLQSRIGKAMAHYSGRVFGFIGDGWWRHDTWRHRETHRLEIHGFWCCFACQMLC